MDLGKSRVFDFEGAKYEVQDIIANADIRYSFKSTNVDITMRNFFREASPAPNVMLLVLEAMEG